MFYTLQEKSYLDEQWLKLLKYHPSFFSSSGYESKAMSSNFFLTKEGATSPKEEYLESLKLFFFSPKIEDQQQACRFPARYLYLAKKNNLKPKNLKEFCPGYGQYVEKVAIKSAYVVFSSYFVNNPASAFGHTFLRFGKSDDDGSGYDLLDYAVNNGAEVTTNNALFYSIYGLMGWFKGHYLVMPYFYKVREYNDFESRDLFSYQLNFNQEELDLLVGHSWEMGQTYFRYYYLDENCSYQIISLIDAIKPEWKLIKKLNMTVIPIDTIKLLMGIEGAIKKVSYRPSLESKFQKKLERLDHQEIEELAYFIKNEGMSGNISKIGAESQGKIYDAAIDYFDKTYPNEILLDDKGPKGIKKNQLLKERSLIDARPLKDNFEKEQSNPPHLSHGSKRFAIGLGVNSNHIGYNEVEFRNSFHDIMDNQNGFPPKMTLVMGDYKGRFYYSNKKMGDDHFLFYSPKRKISLEKFTIIKILSLNPVKQFSNPVSFKVSIGGERVKIGKFKNRFKSGVNVAGGFTKSFFNNALLFYGLLNQDIGYLSDSSRAPLLVGAGPEVGGYFFDPRDRIRINIVGQYLKYFFKNKEEFFSGHTEFRFQLSKNQEISLKYIYCKDEKELNLKLYYFF